MNRKRIIILIVILLTIIGLFIINKRSKVYCDYEFPKTLVVNNYTTHKNIDFYTKIVLNKIFNYDTVVVNYFNLPPVFENHRYEIVGFIEKNPFMENTYSIFVKNRFDGLPIKRFLVHELEHLRQMQEGLLEVFIDFVVYNNDTIVFVDTPYELRQYEIDARKSENDLLRKLTNLLYSCN